jgi:TRAP-type C4-dicarboxylate transport system substrate-binding protein
MKRKFHVTSLAALAAALLAGSAGAQEKLIYATVSPAGGAMNAKVLVPWAKRVEEAGKGAIAFDIREGTTLANFGNVRDRVMNDVVQVGFSLQDAIGGVYPRSEVGGLPGLFDSSSVGSVAFWRLYKSGVLDAEYADIVPFAIAPLGQVIPHMAKPMMSPSDFSGLKLMVGGKVQGDVLSKLNGTPIAINWSDMYEALNRKTIDGAITGWSSVTALKLDEVTSYHVDFPLGTSVAMIFMAKKKYDSLSAASRAALDAHTGEAESKMIGEYYDATSVSVRDKIKSSPNQTVVALDAAQSAAWKAKIGPLLDDWAKTRPDGEKVLAAFRGLIAQARASH